MEKENWTLEIKFIILDPVSVQITSAFDSPMRPLDTVSHALNKLCNAMQAYLKAYSVL